MRTPHDFYDNVLVIIPALNEIEGIGLTIDDVREHLPGCHIVVADNYSDDGTV